MQISKFWLQKSTSAESGEPEESVSDQSEEQELHRFAWTYRLVNVVLHAIATQLFAHILIDHFSVQAKHALLAAVHFAVHPIHTEAVSKLFRTCFSFELFLMQVVYASCSLCNVQPNRTTCLAQVACASRTSNLLEVTYLK